MLTFKKCTLEELDALKEISIQTFAETYGEYNTKENMTRYVQDSLSDDSLTQQINNQNTCFYLAYDQKECIGYIKLTVEKAQSKIYEENSIEIERIYVLKEFQQKGYGQQLMQKSMAVARNLQKKFIWLAVWEENMKAIHFYEKYQFKQLTTIPFKLGGASYTGRVLQKELKEVPTILKQSNADYELIQQDKPIRSAKDAAGYYDVTKSAPTMILESEKGLLAYIKSVESEKINFSELKQTLNYKELKLAKPKDVKELLGYKVGSVPLIGLELPIIFDQRLLSFDYVYGGTGDVYTTLKIAPKAIKRINKIEWMVH